MKKPTRKGRICYAVIRIKNDHYECDGILSRKKTIHDR